MIVSAALLLACALLYSSPQAFAAGQGFPGPVPPACGAFYPGDCLITTRLGALTISPHIVRAGHTVTGTVPTGCVIGFGNNNPCPVGWTNLTVLGAVRDGCGTHDYTCTVRIAPDAPTSVYQAINVTVTNGQGTGYSSDYLAIAGRGTVIVSGRVTEPSANGAVGVSGVSVRAACESGGETTTDDQGKYSFILGRGSCTIEPVPEKHQTSSPERREVSVGDMDIKNIDFTLGCRVDETIADWTLKGDCAPADDTEAGASKVEATPPAGADVALDSDMVSPDPYGLPVTNPQSRWQLSEPVELPDLDLPGVKLMECTLDGHGVSAGVASFEFGVISGVAQDLSFAPDMRSGSVGWLQLQAGGLSIEAMDAHYADGEFSAAGFTLGLPAALGATELSGSGLRVGRGGLAGTIHLGDAMIGDLRVHVPSAQLEGDRLSIPHAAVVLPSYLGSATLTATDLVYDATAGLSVRSVGGKIPAIALGPGNAVPRPGVTLTGVHAELTVDGAGKDTPPSYTIKGGGELSLVEPGGQTLFGIRADFAFASVRCALVPPGGRCEPGHARFLHTASLGVSLPSVPIPETGLVLTGIDGGVHSTEHDPVAIDADGVHGVSYTFILGAGLASQASPGGAPLLKGRIAGSLSTDGNLAAKITNGTLLGSVTFGGAICLIDTLPDDVCVNDVDPATRSLMNIVGTGIYAGGQITASAHVGVPGCHANATLDLRAGGTFVHRGGLAYIQGRGTGTLNGSLHCFGFGSGALGSVDAQLGIFAPVNRYGIKVTTTLSSGTTTRTASFFLDSSKNVTRNAQGYTLEPGTSDIASAAPAADVSGALQGTVWSSPGVSSSGGRAHSALERADLLVPPSVNGDPSSRCDYAVRLMAQAARLRAGGTLGSDPAARFQLDAGSGPPPIPTFNVPLTTPCIAANDAAAINPSRDPSTGAAAVTVRDGAYVPFASAAPDLLQYGPQMTPAQQFADTNRRQACGRDPFFVGAQPGPTDQQVDDVTGERLGGSYTSCDEYPFASTAQGGSNAIIRGVPIGENRRQGGQLSFFYRKYAAALKANGGQFYVCVLGTVGHC